MIGLILFRFPLSFSRSTSLPSTIKSDESPSSSADLTAPPKKTLTTSKSLEPFETKNGRPSSYILQPVVSDVKAANAMPRNRFTSSNLNCCKSCSQETDVDTLGRANVRKVETVTMPRLQQTNGNRSFSEVKYKKPESKKTSTIPSALPNRDAIKATNNIFRKMSLRKPPDIENRFIDSEYRRQSLDDSATMNGKRMTKQLSSIDHTRIGDTQQRMQSYSSNVDRYESNRKLASMLNNNRKQMISDDHLKSLESKIRKHKIDAIRNVKEYTYNPMQSKSSSMLNGANSDAKYLQTKLDQFANSKKRLKEHTDRMNGSFQNMGIDSGLHSNLKAAQSRSAAIGGHNYGIISASDLYKLRTPTESII